MRRGVRRPAAHHEDVGVSGRGSPALGSERRRSGGCRGGALLRRSVSLHRTHPRGHEGRCWPPPEPFRLHGTDHEHEPLLTWATGAMTSARVHLCPEGCSREAEGPGLLHCSDLRIIKSLEELVRVPWRDVLLEGRPKAEDELAGLRSRMDAVGGPSPGAAAAAAEIEEKEAKEKEDKEKKKAKKKKKKKRKRSRIRRGQRAESQREGDQVKEKKEGGGERALAAHPVQRAVHPPWNSRRSPQEVLFRGSGMDPLMSRPEEAATPSSAHGPTISPQEGREQIGVVGRRGALALREGRSDLRRVPENQRDRLTVSRCFDIASNRTDARVAGTGSGARSSAGGPLEPHFTQILQTNAIPQNVRSDVQGSSDALYDRRSIIEGHDARDDGHPDSEIEVVRGETLRNSSTRSSPISQSLLPHSPFPDSERRAGLCPRMSTPLGRASTPGGALPSSTLGEMHGGRGGNGTSSTSAPSGSNPRFVVLRAENRAPARSVVCLFNWAPVTSSFNSMPRPGFLPRSPRAAAVLSVLRP